MASALQSDEIGHPVDHAAHLGGVDQFHHVVRGMINRVSYLVRLEN